MNQNAVQALAKHHTQIEHTDPDVGSDEEPNPLLCTCYADAEAQIRALWDAGYDVAPRTIANVEEAPAEG